MKLREWIAKSGHGSAFSLAKKCGLSPSTITWAKRRPPSLSVALAIMEHTGGQVTLDDFYGSGAVPCWQPIETAPAVGKKRLIFELACGKTVIGYRIAGTNTVRPEFADQPYLALRWSPIPRHDLMEAIYTHTGRKVTPNDFMGVRE